MFKDKRKTDFLFYSGTENILDRLTRLVFTDHIGVEDNCIVIGKNLVVHNPDIVREFQDKHWLQRVVELFAQCSLPINLMSTDIGILPDIISFIIIVTSLHHSAVNIFVDLKVVPIALRSVVSVLFCVFDAYVWELTLTHTYFLQKK